MRQKLNREKEREREEERIRTVHVIGNSYKLSPISAQLKNVRALSSKGYQQVTVSAGVAVDVAAKSADM